MQEYTQQMLKCLTHEPCKFIEDIRSIGDRKLWVIASFGDNLK